MSSTDRYLELEVFRVTPVPILETICQVKDFIGEEKSLEVFKGTRKVKVRKKRVYEHT